MKLLQLWNTCDVFRGKELAVLKLENKSLKIQTNSIDYEELKNFITKLGFSIL